jgi:hypothetical protein
MRVIRCTCPDIYVSAPDDFDKLDHHVDCPAWRLACEQQPSIDWICSPETETSIERKVRQVKL